MLALVSTEKQALVSGISAEEHQQTGIAAASQIGCCGVHTSQAMLGKSTIVRHLSHIGVRLQTLFHDLHGPYNFSVLIH
jgi:hypothetical protein